MAQYMVQKGRVAISELAAKSNTFIDLEEKSGAAVHAAGADFDLDLGLEADEQGEAQQAPGEIDFDV